VTTSSVVLVVLAGAGFPLLLWAIGRAVTAAGDRTAYRLGPSRQYLAGCRYGVRISELAEDWDELLVSLSTPEGRAMDDPLTQVFRVTASPRSLERVRRWHAEGTVLRAYLSRDGAVMLTDPALGGSAACEPRVTTIQWAR